MAVVRVGGMLSPIGTGDYTFVNLSLNCGAGADFLLLFIRSSTTSPTSITYAGAALSYLTGGGGIGAYYKKLPAAGTNTLRINAASYTGHITAVLTFSGVDQTTPYGSAVSKAWANGTNPTLPSMTCPIDGLIVGVGYAAWSPSNLSAKSGTTLVHAGSGGAGFMASGQANSTLALGWWGGDAAVASGALGMPINPYVIPAGSLIARRGGPSLGNLLRM